MGVAEQTFCRGESRMAQWASASCLGCTLSRLGKPTDNAFIESLNDGPTDDLKGG
jgi:transposase InsO family protein